jgi:hypothetical protein
MCKLINKSIGLMSGLSHHTHNTLQHRLVLRLQDFSATSSDFVTITSAHGSYVIPGGLDVQYAVLQRQQGPTVWERCFLSGGKVALRDVASGRYLSAQGDGRICTVVYLLACEKLELVPVGDSGAKFAFKFEAYLQGKRLLQAPSGEGRLVLEPVHSGCSASDVREGQWTVFHLQPAPIPIADSPGYNTSEVSMVCNTSNAVPLVGPCVLSTCRVRLDTCLTNTKLMGNAYGVDLALCRCQSINL